MTSAGSLSLKGQDQCSKPWPAVNLPVWPDQHLQTSKLFPKLWTNSEDQNVSVELRVYEAISDYANCQTMWPESEYNCETVLPALKSLWRGKNDSTHHQRTAAVALAWVSIIGGCADHPVSDLGGSVDAGWTAALCIGHGPKFWFTVKDFASSDP